jgi:type IV secretory pathway TrbD component
MHQLMRNSKGWYLSNKPTRFEQYEQKLVQFSLGFLSGVLFLGLWLWINAQYGV